MAHSALILIVFTAIFVPASGWGSQGHRITAAIAVSRLNKRAVEYVNSILAADSCGPQCSDGQNLVSCANWADDVKSTHDWSWSRSLHFVNTPDEACTYSYRRDCPTTSGGGKYGWCAVGAISNYTRQIQQSHALGTLKRSFRSPSTDNAVNFTGNFAISESAVSSCALKFIDHFIGDVHQPLHVAFTSDLGGNTEKVYWYGHASSSGYPHSLHGVWDYDIIQKHMSDSCGSVTSQKCLTQYEEELIANISDNDVAKWSACVTEDNSNDWILNCANLWATESLADACKWSYRDANGDDIAFKSGTKLADPYYTTRIPIVNDRLSKGGVRLAAVLNKLFPADSPPAPTPTPPKPSPGRNNTCAVQGCGFTKGAPCQCNSLCEVHDDCCNDYVKTCNPPTSCAVQGCKYNAEAPCKCNDKCDEFDDCCSDYKIVCGQKSWRQIILG